MSTPDQIDITRSLSKLLVLYALPITAIILAAWLGSAISKTVVFALAFAIMGAACVINSRGCGRVHCAFTGLGFY